MKRLFLMTLMLGLACIANAQDVWVDAANEGGTEDGTTEATAWGTIAEGITDAASGETIAIKGGTVYTLSSALTTGDKTLYLEGYTTTFGDNGRAAIDGNSAVANDIYFNSATADTWLSLKNLEIYGATGDGVYLDGGNISVHLYNCIVRNNGDSGVDGSNTNSHRVSATNCVFAYNAGDGMKTVGGGSAVDCLFVGNTLRGANFRSGIAVRCVAVDNGDDGFYLGIARSTLAGAFNCVADTNGGNGFEVWFAGGLVANCISIRNTGYGVIAGTAMSVYVSNTYIGQTAGAFANTAGQTSGSPIVTDAINDLNADPFTAIWTTTTNETWQGQDYRVTTDSGLFDVLQAVGPLDSAMQAYTSVGSKVANPASFTLISNPQYNNLTPLQSATAGQLVYVTLVLASDHSTAATGITPDTLTLQKGTGTPAAFSDGTWTEIGGGLYTVTCDATDSGTDGQIIVAVTEATVDDAWAVATVGSAAAYDDTPLLAILGTPSVDIATDIGANGTAIAAVDAKLGTPAGASVSSDIAANKAALDLKPDSTDLDDTPTIASAVTTDMDANSTQLSAIVVNTGTTIPAAQATAQSDLDTITGTDGVTLATDQANYAPAKAGDQMDMVDAPNSTAVTAIVTAALAGAVDGSVDLQTALARIMAVTTGKNVDSGTGPFTITYYAADGTTPLVTHTIAADGTTRTVSF